MSDPASRNLPPIRPPYSGPPAQAQPGPPLYPPPPVPGYAVGPPGYPGYPGGAPGYPAPMPPAGPPRAPQRGPGWKKGLLIGLPVLLLLVVAGAILAHPFSRRSAGPAAAQPVTSATPADTATFTPPSIADVIKAKQTAAAAAVTTALTAQADSLLAGDKAKFLSLASPQAKYVAPWLADRFTSLRALGVAQWTPEVTSATSGFGGRWQVDVTVHYCFVKGCTRPSTVTLHSQWNLLDPTHPLLTEIFAYDTDRQTPPWAESVLQAKSGSRVVVAATAANAGRLSAALAAGEAAARVADRYATSTPPSKYVIYLASPAEWSDWPDTEEGKWVAGVAFQESESVIINVANAGTGALDVLLRHELGHVATLAGEVPAVSYTKTFWLAEGLAEYVAYQPKGFAGYGNKAGWTTRYVHSGWNGNLQVAPPGTGASAGDAAGHYGVAFLGVTCLAQTYTEPKMLAFFDAVAVRGIPVETAATQQLGAAWPAVNSTCAAKVRQAAR